jgi:O-acetyl-ADP-ribose deacetylase (regulator of RNase III)
MGVRGDTVIERGLGSLLEADAEALVNTVNCVGVMGKGLALDMKRAYPENYVRYRQACAAGEVRPGRMLIVPTGAVENPRLIINFPTKRHWKGRSRIEDIEAGLQSLVAEVRQLGVRSIAVPALGCGNGGLDWAQVRPLIVAAFANLPDIRVVLFDPAEGVSEGYAQGPNSFEPLRHEALLLKLMDAYRSSGYRLSLYEARLLLYLLQVAGEPIGITSIANPTGRSATCVAQVLTPMIGRLFRLEERRHALDEIVIEPAALRAASRMVSSDSDASERYERIVRLIRGFETPYGLELLATVHWAAHHHLEGALDPDGAVRAVHAGSARARRLVKPEHAHKAWQRLNDNGWLARGAILKPLVLSA